MMRGRATPPLPPLARPATARCCSRRGTLWTGNAMWPPWPEQRHGHSCGPAGARPRYTTYQERLGASGVVLRAARGNGGAVGREEGDPLRTLVLERARVGGAKGEVRFGGLQEAGQGDVREIWKMMMHRVGVELHDSAEPVGFTCTARPLHHGPATADNRRARASSCSWDVGCAARAVRASASVDTTIAKGTVTHRHGRRERIGAEGRRRGGGEGGEGGEGDNLHRGRSTGGDKATCATMG